MARSKSFFGLRRGSTKSLTFQVFRGQQITKDRVTDVSNPQSEAQMMQRMKVPLVASARAALKELINHSFEGTAYGEESLKLFSSLNLAKGALTVKEYVPKSAMDCGAADFIVSRGSLDSTTTSFSTSSESESMFLKSISYTPVTTFKEQTLPDNQPDVEVSEENYNLIMQALGLGPNEQLTFLIELKGSPYIFDAGDVGEVEGHYHNFVVSRLINDYSKATKWKIDENVDEGSYISITDGYIRINIAETKTFRDAENYADLGLVNMGAEFYSVYSAGNGTTYPCAAAVIYSQQAGNVWKRSSQRLQINPHLDSSQDFEDCLPSYLKPTTESNRYLNTGTAGVDITGGEKTKYVKPTPNP